MLIIIIIVIIIIRMKNNMNKLKSRRGYGGDWHKQKLTTLPTTSKSPSRILQKASIISWLENQ